MIDHVLGRPSVKFRKIQVVAVLSFWSLYLSRGHRHGPPGLRRLSHLLSNRLTTWQTLVATLLCLYVSRNFAKIIGLESPEPLANLYNRSYFRATWVTTALDAGFWTAMRIRHRWARDFLSLIFTLYYLVCAEQADEKVRKIRGSLTVEHLRVSWNKSTTPYLSALTGLLRPRLMRYPPRALRIPRPAESAYKEPVHAWLYFDGPLSELKKHREIILDIPGGGFVAMTPRNHDDKLMAWAGKTELPVLSLDYRKAPEYPYPYALNECYDTYHTIVASAGRCLGLSGEHVPKIIVAGDSAGGNLAVGLVLMILQSGSTDSRRWQGEDLLPAPEGVVLIYPSLDMNIGNWMTDEQMSLIKDRRVRKTNENVLRRKSDDYRKLTPSTPHHSDDEEEGDLSTAQPHPRSPTTQMTIPKDLTSPATAIHISAAHTNIDTTAADSQASKPQALRTRLAMSSIISYFNDRILSPEMMRAMIVLYIGPHSRPDFSTDFLLSPLLAPESLLARFPKTYFLTGERDPLVDDTVIFAGRLRQAKAARLQERKELGLESERTMFVEHDHVEVVLIPGISHGFFQFIGVFPEGWKYVFQCGQWMQDIFARSDQSEQDHAARKQHGDKDGYFIASHHRNGPKVNPELAAGLSTHRTPRHHRRTRTGESSGDDDRPLEMSVAGRVSPGHHASTENPPATKTRRYRPVPARQKSLISLASEEDLLGRRMKNLTGGLRLREDVDEIPPTP